MLRHSLLTSLLLASLGLALGACGAEDEGPTPYDGEAPVSPYDPLLEGAPDNDTLPDENKADAVYPKQHSDLVALQSPVKSQGRRGVCSIFSTTALMEHLYIVEGTIPNPDFSEQYMQWAAKFLVRSFPNTSGSNAYYNLRAASGYGIVTEDVWPYEINQWGTADDAACDGSDAQPTRCYTNGEPPAAADGATKFKLPPGRYLNTNSIKAHITGSGHGVVVGMTFFYQSWNHRASDLPVNNDNWRQGIVMYPNAKDKELSLAKRAGHSILIVGWDDEMEVAQRDENGDVVVGDDGEPVMEKGFYIFKNSWGADSFGVDNPYGAGYGFLSMRYVEEYGSAYVSAPPVLDLPDEICDDGIDNDLDQAVDCDDTNCADEAVCRGDIEVLTFTSDMSVDIPDNDAVGASSTIVIDDSATIQALSVVTDIVHTYRGDLQVVLHRGDQTVVLHDRTGGGQDDLKQTFPVTAFDGTDMTGEWKLVVTDRASQDTGYVSSWKLEVLVEGVAP